MKDSEGDFSAWKPHVGNCRKCNVGQVSFRKWESLCGGYEDYQFKCGECGHLWWIEGADA